MTNDQLQAIEKRADLAFAEIVSLSRGTRRWTMRVPVQETDSDQVLNAVVHDVRALVKEVNRLRLFSQDCAWKAHCPEYVRYRDEQWSKGLTAVGYADWLDDALVKANATIDAMRHDLETTEGLWCMDSKPEHTNAFRLEHSSLRSK